MGSDKILKREKCPNAGCDGKGDNLAVYEDGHKHCFSCGYHLHAPKTTQNDSNYTPRKGGSSFVVKDAPAPPVKKPVNFITGEYRDLPDRKITKETCQVFKYLTAFYNGSSKPVQVSQFFYKDGSLSHQKIRFVPKEKSFPQIGEAKNSRMFGIDLFSPETFDTLIITEGEIDAMTVYQLKLSGYAVCSLPAGTGSVEVSLKNNFDEIDKYKKVIIMFDNDDAGRVATEKALEVLNRYKTCVAITRLKDANEMYVNGNVDELKQCILSAKVAMPEGLNFASDRFDELMKFDVKGTDLAYPKLSKAIKGIKSGQVITVGGGTGMGKTTFICELAFDLFRKQNKKVAFITLEQVEKDILRKMLAIKLNMMLDDEDLFIDFVNENGIELVKEEYADLFGEKGNESFIINSEYAQAKTEDFIRYIRFIRIAYGVDVVFLDHLTWLVVNTEKKGKETEKDLIDKTMQRLKDICKETGLIIILAVHVNKGKDFAGGGEIDQDDFRGSAGIAQTSDIVIGLYGDRYGDSPNRTYVKVIKCRRAGGTLGTVCALNYWRDTGRLLEVQNTDEDAKVKKLEEIDRKMELKLASKKISVVQMKLDEVGEDMDDVPF